MTKQSFVYFFFKLTFFTMALAAVFPERKPLKNRVVLFLLYTVWPVVFVAIWVPLVPMVVLKALQFASVRNWDELLDIMHMFILGCFTLYMVIVLHITSSNIKITMEIVETKFRVKNEIGFTKFFVVLIFWVIVPLCVVIFISGCVYYQENLVPLWVPFVDNDKELSAEVFYGIWVYEMLAAPYILITFTVWGPFIIVSTVCICHELKYLSNAVNWYGSVNLAMEDVKEDKEDKVGKGAHVRVVSHSGSDMLRFVKKVVLHHLTIKSAINNVARINSYVFLVQTFVTVVHSCVLAFNLYYTTHVEKVMLKSSPILFFSYYLMFAYCWNGQQLTNKSEELVTALYHLPWYKCPHSYKTSMLIMMECLKKPVYLTGGGIIKATLETFITCFQQSFSYILVLKALTPEKGRTLLDKTLQENITTQTTDGSSWLTGQSNSD